MNGKKIITILIIIISLAAIIIGIIYKNYSNKEKSFYATITEVNDGYILIKPLKGEKISDKTKRIIIYTEDSYQKEDTVIIYYKGEIRETDPSTINVTKIELVSTTVKKEENISDDNSSPNDDIDKSTNNNDNNNHNDDIISNNSQNNNQSNDQSSSVQENYTEDDVIEYFNEKLEEVSVYDKTTNYKEKAKELFITLVDFLFYDGEIKGYKFKELSNSAKLKILNITFNIDSKLEEKFPDYKQELSDKYQDIKNMIAAKYLEITTEICTNNDSYCETAKKAWNTIKEKTSISWSTIKKYASSGISNLKEWYNIYSGKTS